MTLEAFHAAFTIDGFFITQAEADRLINALKKAGYTLRTNAQAHPGDGGISGFWKFTLDQRRAGIEIVANDAGESDEGKNEDGDGETKPTEPEGTETETTEDAAGAIDED